MENHDKKYKVLENILQKINQKYVALPDDERKRNNILLKKVIEPKIEKMKSKNVLFANLYESIFYGGSFYDGLKVGNPTEFDLDCLLRLPKIIEPRVVVSDKPGYVHLIVNMKALENKPDESPKFIGFEKFLDGDRLSTKKVRSWMESLITSAMDSNMVIPFNEKDSCKIKSKVKKSGPAQTFLLNGVFNNVEFNIDIDLVPCFKFFDDNWPQGDYRRNPSEKKNSFFVVPKSPSDAESSYWRLSFQEQERELISGGKSLMKPTIRLIKKIRDRHNHNIASYFIKTIFLWEAQNEENKDLWKKNQSFVFVRMLQKYSEYIGSKTIPYYWNDRYNLIADLSVATASNISNKIRNIVEHIDRMCNHQCDLWDIVPYFLTLNTSELEKLKEEVPMSKKLQKLQAAPSVPVVAESAGPSRVEYFTTGNQVAPIVVQTGNGLKQTSSDSSGNSSFEEIPNVNQDVSQTLSRIEFISANLLSQQKKMSGMLEDALGKIENCENQIAKLTIKLDNIDRKVDRMGASHNSNSSASTRLLDDLLTDRLTTTLNHYRNLQ